MTVVKIPFLARFREPMLNGIKTWTSRTRKMVMPADTFEAFGANFQIIRVETEVPLHGVAEHWRQEGCSSWEDFIRVWESIHPRRGFNPDQNVVVHIFKKISEEEKP